MNTKLSDTMRKQSDKSRMIVKMTKNQMSILKKKKRKCVISRRLKKNNTRCHVFFLKLDPGLGRYL
jgi:hypothetical protein